MKKPRVLHRVLAPNAPSGCYRSATNRIRLTTRRFSAVTKIKQFRTQCQAVKLLPTIFQTFQPFYENQPQSGKRMNAKKSADFFLFFLFFFHFFGGEIFRIDAKGGENINQIWQPPSPFAVSEPDTLEQPSASRAKRGKPRARAVCYLVITRTNRSAYFPPATLRSRVYPCRI